MFKKLVWLSLAALLVVGLVACEPEEEEPVEEEPVEEEEVKSWEEIQEAAQEEGEVVVYSSGDPEMEEMAVQAFEEETGIEVEYSRPGGGEELIRQVHTEREAGQHLVDVATFTDITQGMYARDHDWVVTIHDEQLPNTENLLPEYQEEEYELFPAYTLPMPIMYNTELVDEEEVPETYEELADPRWEDQISFGEPENAGASAVTIGAWVEKYGWDFIEDLKDNNLTETRLSTEAAEMVARGEREIAVMPTIWAYAMQYQDMPVEVYYPDGLIATEAVSAVLSDGPNPNAAKVFKNFMLSEGWVSAYDHSQIGIWFPFEGEWEADEHLPEDPDMYELDLEQFYQDKQDIIDEWRHIMG